MENGGKRLLGKVAVVTASTAGIGLGEKQRRDITEHSSHAGTAALAMSRPAGIAERLGKEGASLVISSRKQVVACDLHNISIASQVA